MKKGVSITALTMYVLVLTIIIGVIAVFNINVLGNTNDFVRTSKMFEQYTKFNMFFLELLEDNQTVEIVSDGVIVIYTSTGSSMIEYDSINKEIKYTTFSNTITICEFVDSFSAVAVGNTLRIDMSLSVGDVTYHPQIVYYAVGGWVQ